MKVINPAKRNVAVAATGDKNFVFVFTRYFDIRSGEYFYNSVHWDNCTKQFFIICDDVALKIV